MREDIVFTKDELKALELIGRWYHPPIEGLSAAVFYGSPDTPEERRRYLRVVRLEPELPVAERLGRGAR
jgi:hypothetical protein